MRDEILDIQNILKIDVQFYKDCKSCIPAIIDVCKKFDGKVLNKRFTDATREATTGKFSINNRMYVAVDFVTEFGDKCLSIEAYANNELFYGFFYKYVNDKDWDAFFTKSPGGKDRLIAESVIKEIEKNDTVLSQNIIEIGKSIPKIKEYVDTYNAMIDNIEKYVKAMPYDVRGHIGKSYLCRSLIDELG